MPINELERHPFLKYIDTEIDQSANYKGLIIGSFPVYSCTDTVDNNLDIIEQRFNPDDVTMRFFYCSKQSKFWEYCSSAFGEINPVNKLNNETKKESIVNARQRTIDFLNRNNLLIKDVIYQTNRKDYGDEDSNLLQLNGAENWIVQNLSLNHRISNILDNHHSITNLYFTARGLTGNNPFALFKTIFGNRLVVKESYSSGFKITINRKEYNVFLLPTPKPRGIHFTDKQRNPFFESYMQNMDLNFYDLIRKIKKSERTNDQNDRIKILRHNFLVESYKQAFVHKNLSFKGIVGND